MTDTIPCHRGGHACRWPACSMDCDGRPGRSLDLLLTALRVKFKPRRRVTADSRSGKAKKRLMAPGEYALQKLLTHRAYARQDGRCYHCKEAVPFEEITGDHYPIPWYAGGKTRADNIVAACAKCNAPQPEAQRTGGALDRTFGDPTPRSPFEVLAKLKDQP